MKILELLFKLKTKEFKPKVYTLVLSGYDQPQRMLWLGTAYSFDEAFARAYSQAVRDFPNCKIWKQEMWSFSNIEDLLLPFCYTETKKEEDQEQKIEPQVINKNDLMRKIITENDLKLYKKNKNILNEKERSLVQDELKRISQK